MQSNHLIKTIGVWFWSHIVSNTVNSSKVKRTAQQVIHTTFLSRITSLITIITLIEIIETQTDHRHFSFWQHTNKDREIIVHTASATHLHAWSSKEYYHKRTAYFSRVEHWMQSRHASSYRPSIKLSTKIIINRQIKIDWEMIIAHLKKVRMKEEWPHAHNKKVQS